MRQLTSWLDARLAGQPDAVITLLLLLVAGLGIVIALKGPRILKAGVLAWWLLP